MLEKTHHSHTLTPFADGDGTIGALARCRQSVLQRATKLFDNRRQIPVAEEFDALPNALSLLMTSLEELKVAEEELREQNSLLIQQRGVVDERASYYRQLFQHAPAPAFVTDVHGSIQEANLAAVALFRREAKHLEHKPVQALVSAGAREEFRRQLSRVQSEDGVSNWRIVFQRTGDVPVTVSASVTFVRAIDPAARRALYWLLRVIE